jgi:hypothetical protein
MQKTILIFCALILFPAAAAAGEKTHTFAASCDQVWAAEKTVVAANYDLSKFDEATQTAKFEKPHTMNWAAVNITISLSPGADTCTMRISYPAKIGTNGFSISKFTGQVEDQLKRGK